VYFIPQKIYKLGKSTEEKKLKYFAPKKSISVSSIDESSEAISVTSSAS
jgi:hypothetical protein